MIVATTVSVKRIRKFGRKTTAVLDGVANAAACGRVASRQAPRDNRANIARDCDQAQTDNPN
jgi:hypothetical protein